jgi:hypothetical protein
VVERVLETPARLNPVEQESLVWETQVALLQLLLVPVVAVERAELALTEARKSLALAALA